MSGCETLTFISTHHPLVWHKFNNARCCERALSRHNMVSNSPQLKLTLVDMSTKIAINFGLRGPGDKWPRPLRFMRVATGLDLFSMQHVIKISKLQSLHQSVSSYNKTNRTNEWLCIHKCTKHGKCCCSDAILILLWVQRLEPQGLQCVMTV